MGLSEARPVGSVQGESGGKKGIEAADVAMGDAAKWMGTKTTASQTPRSP